MVLLLKFGRAARADPVVVPDIFLGLKAIVSYRPLPLAQLAFSATGSARIAPRRHQQGRGDVPSRRKSVTQFFRCVRVGYTGEDAICRAAARHECLPCADFFGYFLVRGGLSSQMQHFLKSNFIRGFPAKTLSGTKV